jgi:hypothetical protein
MPCPYRFFFIKIKMSNYNPQYHHRRSIRLPEYNYRQSGYYFVTICTYKKQCWFGEIINQEEINSKINHNLIILIIN